MEHERELSKLRGARQDCNVAVHCSPPPRDVNFRKKVGVAASMRKPVVKRLQLDKVTEKPPQAPLEPSNGTERDRTETENYLRSDDEGDKERKCDHSREDPVYDDLSRSLTKTDTHITTLSEKERLHEQLRMIAWSLVFF